MAPWIALPDIAAAARDNGWQILGERGSVARWERRDPRSASGAVRLHVQFDQDGHIERAWIAELDREVRDQATMLPTVLEWIAEDLPAQQ